MLILHTFAGIGDTSAKNAMVLVSSRSEINEVFDQFGHQHVTHTDHVGHVGETKPAVQAATKAVHTPPPRPPPVRPAPIRPPPVVSSTPAEVERGLPVHSI